MADNHVTANMSLTVPTPSVEVGPDYAQHISDALDLVDLHDHTGAPSGGKQLNSAALNLDDDVSMNGHSLTDVHSVDTESQVGTLAGARRVYSVGDDLYYNDGAGTPIQLTANGSVSAPSSSAILNFRLVNSNIVIGATDTDILYGMVTSAPRTVQLPLLADAPAGRQYIFADVTGGASANKVTINRSGADTFVNGATSAKLSISDGWVTVVSCVTHWAVVSLFDNGSNTWGVGNAPAQSISGLCLSHSSTIGARNAGDSGDIIWMFPDASDNVCVGDASTNVLIAGAALGIGTSGLAGSGNVRMASAGAIRRRNAGGTGDIDVIVPGGATDAISVGDASVCGGVNILCKGGTQVGLFGNAAGGGAVTCGDSGTTISHGGTPRITTTSTGIGFFNHGSAAQQNITGALSTVADAPAKAVLTSIIAALTNLGLTTNGTT